MKYRLEYNPEWLQQVIYIKMKHCDQVFWDVVQVESQRELNAALKSLMAEPERVRQVA